MSAGSSPEHLSKQSGSEDGPQDLVAQTTTWLTQKERSPMNLYSCVSGNILQSDVQDNLSQSGGDVEGSSPPRIWSGSSGRRDTSPKETLSSIMKHENLQPGYSTPNSNHNPLQDPGENPQPLECAFSPPSANNASNWLPLQQTCGKELANSPKPEACNQSERTHEHQTATSLFFESSEGTLADRAYLLTQKMDAFTSPRKRPKMAVTNPNAFYKAACDSIAKLRTSFDHYIKEKMEALGRLAPALLWMDTRSSPEALEAMETVQATAASCDYIVKFLNWSPTRLSVERGQWKLSRRGAGWGRGCRPSRQRKVRLLKPEKFFQRAIQNFPSAKLGKSRPKRKRVCLKASKHNRKA